MADEVSVSQLRANLATYLRRAHEGERITVTRGAWEAAVLGPVTLEENTSDPDDDR